MGREAEKSDRLFLENERPAEGVKLEASATGRRKQPIVEGSAG
jgi:hypothetical protein